MLQDHCPEDLMDKARMCCNDHQCHIPWGELTFFNKMLDEMLDDDRVHLRVDSFARGDVNIKRPFFLDPKQPEVRAGIKNGTYNILCYHMSVFCSVYRSSAVRSIDLALFSH